MDWITRTQLIGANSHKTVGRNLKLLWSKEKERSHHFLIQSDSKLNQLRLVHQRFPTIKTICLF